MDDEPIVPFVPYATMFKVSGPDSGTVECVSCHAVFPLEDLMDGELEEDECPVCDTSAEEYWDDKDHLQTPD